MTVSAETIASGGGAAERSLSTTAVRRLLCIALLAGLLPLMDWVYVHVLVDRYGEVGYPGFPNEYRGAVFTLACWVLGLVPAAWLALDLVRPSQLLYWCVYLLVYVPTAVIGARARMAPERTIMMMLVMLGGLLVVHAVSRLPTLRMPRVRIGRRLFWAGLIVLSGVAYALTWATYGGIIRLVSLADVYLQRGAWAEAGGGPLVRYLMLWQSVVINPFLVAYGIVRRRPSLVLAGTAGQLFFFMVSAQRQFLAAPLMILAIAMLLRGSGRGFWLKAGAGCAVLFTIPVMLVERASVAVLALNDLVLYRLFYNNGFLSVLYFDYFSTNPVAGFAFVKPFSWVTTSPHYAQYRHTYKEALSWDVWGQFSDPNANFLADGFAQLHVLGTLVECLGVGLAFWLLDSAFASRRIPFGLAALIAGSQIIGVVNGQVPNLLLGGGFLLTIALLYVVPVPPSRDPRDAGETAA